mmetsp:Transcript_54411/g.90133  ORF Transcript_54411/g.90133 Transcript_54411/m.90133 type:complete len:725 (-) Transcript_54411:82-2256(-)
MSHLVEVEKNFQVFVGIDFGTDGTGLAIALPNGEVYIHSKWKGYTRSQEVKPKTRILLDADGNFLAFGQPATNSYITMGGEKSQWLLFERFKMALYEKQKKSDDDDDENSDDNNENENVDINEKIRAVNGTEYEASKVFIEALKYIKSQVFKFLSKMKLQIKTVDDVQWILTVPAIWSEKAKFKMEQWSIEAGLINKQIPHHLKIVYEPDCASLSIQHEIKELKAKKKAAVLAKRKLEAKQKVDDDQVEDADVDKAKDNENDNENKNENANVSNVADEDESVKKENVDSDAEMQDNSAADKDENDKEKDDALDKDNGNNNDNDNEQSEQQAAYKEQNPDKDTEEAQEEEEEVVAAKQDEDNDEEKEEQDQDNDKDKQEGDGEDDNEVKAEVADQDKGDEIVQNEAEQPAVADADGDADADADASATGLGLGLGFIGDAQTQYVVIGTVGSLLIAFVCCMAFCCYLRKYFRDVAREKKHEANLNAEIRSVPGAKAKSKRSSRSKVPVIDASPGTSVRSEILLVQNASLPDKDRRKRAQGDEHAAVPNLVMAGQAVMAMSPTVPIEEQYAQSMSKDPERQALDSVRDDSEVIAESELDYMTPRPPGKQLSDDTDDVDNIVNVDFNAQKAPGAEPAGGDGDGNEDVVLISISSNKQAAKGGRDRDQQQHEQYSDSDVVDDNMICYEKTQHGPDDASEVEDQEGVDVGVGVHANVELQIEDDVTQTKM